MDLFDTMSYNRRGFRVNIRNAWSRSFLRAIELIQTRTSVRLLKMSSQKKSFLTTPNVETNSELFVKPFKVLLKWQWWWNFTAVCIISSNFEIHFLEFPWGNCFWCHFKQFFLSLASRKCKNDGKTRKVFLVQNFCPLETEVTRSPNGFRLNISFLVNPIEKNIRFSYWMLHTIPYSY